MEERVYKRLRCAISILWILTVVCVLTIGALLFYELYCLFSLTALGDWWVIVVGLFGAIAGASIVSMLVLDIIYHVKKRKETKKE